MLPIKLLISVFLTFFFFNITQAQEESDSSSTNEETFNNHEDWFDFDWDRDGFQLKGSPTISLSYGQSKPNHKDFVGSFEKPYLLELKLGYTTLRPYKYSDDILKYRYGNVFLSNYFVKSSDSNPANAKIETEMWRFGIGSADGYGYDLGDAAIIPYHSTSINWSRVKFKNVLADSMDANIADRFNESFRFGSAAEAGVRFQIIPLISIEAGYERSVIFERHLFWKWAGSGIIEMASQGILDHFIKKIGKSTPAALPIINVLLKGALSYGIYELRQEKMNWPFNSAALLSYDQWKVGVTFNF
jgi:hypothetical protein